MQVGRPRSPLKLKSIKGTVHIITIITAILYQALTMYTIHGFMHCLKCAETFLVSSSTSFKGVRSLTPQRGNRIVSHRRGGCRLHVAQLQGVPRIDVIDLYVYYENFLADGSKESQGRLFLISPKSPVGWSRGHLSPRPWTTVPWSCAVERLSLVAALAWPAGVRLGRVMSFPSISPPRLCASPGNQHCCDVGCPVAVFGRIWTPPPWCSLFTGQDASQGRCVALPEPPSPAPGSRVGGRAQTGTPALGTAGIATQALPSYAGPGGGSGVLSVRPALCPPPRVETLIPLLQQVGGAVWGDHLRGHHVPSHLVGGPHRHRCGPLPPALCDLQEARCAVAGCPGGQASLLTLRLPSRPACQLSRRACLSHCALKGPPLVLQPHPFPRVEEPPEMCPLRAHTSTTRPPPRTHRT